jgi:hypothetical protein
MPIVSLSTLHSSTHYKGGYKQQEFINDHMTWWLMKIVLERGFY